ncbi:MAG: hypothetical protein ACO1SX_07630 [Actinomycetota bacterium]
MISPRSLACVVSALAALTAGTLHAAEPQPTEILLRYRFEPGQTLRLRTTAAWVIKFGGAPGMEPTSFTTDQRLNRAEKVVDLSGDIATLATQTESATVVGKMPGKGLFGSTYKDGKLSSYWVTDGKKTPSDASSEWVATRLARLDARGNRVAEEGKVPAAPDDYWRPTFPEGPLKVGESWKTQLRFAPSATPPPTAGAPALTPLPSGDVELSLTHTLVKLKGREGKRVATILTVGAQRELKSAAGSSTAVIDASTEFDVDRGVILSGKSRSVAEGESRHETPATADQPAFAITLSSHITDQTSVELVDSKRRK